MDERTLAHVAPFPAQGSYAAGFAPLAHQFAEHLVTGAEVGAGLTVYQRERCVVDLWGGHADVERQRPWQRDTRVVVFSVTKGLVAMALNLLGDRGKLDWDAPVSSVWPNFAEAGKGAITHRTLFNHRGGLLGLDEAFSLDDCVNPARYPALLRSLERQAPLWEAERGQGYHAATFGMYAREVFERIAGESLGTFLRREVFEPLGADVSLGTPPDVDDRIATLYPPGTGDRLKHMLVALVRDPDSREARVARALASRDSLVRRSFFNPSPGKAGLRAFDSVPVRRAELAWVGATASAHGLARAYLPFAGDGSVDGRRFLRSASLAPLYRRQGWAERDGVLQKPLGWSQGFLKEERGLFSPHVESFGHAGIGGSLGWCDPVSQLTFGYVMNKLDWRVRSPRAIALCRSLYRCEPVRDGR